MESRRTYAPARWRLFSKTWLAILVAALAAITAVSGLCGFSQQYRTLLKIQAEEKSESAQTATPPGAPVTPTARMVLSADWSIPVYKTFQLFLLNSGTEDDTGHPSNWMLTIARSTAIAFLMLLSGAAIVNVWDQVVAVPRQLTQKNHIVICGLGQIGLRILDDLLKLPLKRQIVIIENKPDNIWLEYARRLNAVIVIGDLSRAAILREARAEHAAEVFIVTGDDGVNLEVAAELGTLLKTSKRGETSSIPVPRTNPLRLYVHIADVNFSSTLQPNSHVLHNSKAMQVHVFNVPRGAATRLITEQVVSHAPTTADEVAHFVIIGFGAMGQILAVQLAQLAHFANHQRCRFTIIDKDVRSTARGFLTRFPRFTSWTKDEVGVPSFSRESDSWTFNSHPLPDGIHVPYVDAVQYACNAEFIDQPGDAVGELLVQHLVKSFSATDTKVKPVVFICGQQDRENFETAVRLRRQFENSHTDVNKGRAVPIFVWLPRQPALAENLREGTGFAPFGECQAAASYREITCPLREELGKAIHAEHEKHKLVPDANPQPERWEDTRDDFRESSRAAADHAIIKLAAIGQSLKIAQSGTPNSSPLVAVGSPEELMLAEMEHNRWVAERLMSDWRYFPTGSDPQVIASKKEQRLNHTITPWENLETEERDKDIRQVHTVLKACLRQYRVE